MINLCECKVYDYIVVGGGTTANVVAGRLSADKKVDVLMLERGQDVSANPTVKVDTINSVVPPVDVTALPTEYFYTKELGLAAQTSKLVVPFALGGGPAVSGSFWGRGDPKNYNEWAQLVGDNRLTYANLLPFFKKTENVLLSQSNSVDRGRTGPIQVSILDHTDANVTPYVNLMTNVFNVTYGLDYSTSNGTTGLWPMQRSLVREPICNVTSGPCTRSTSYTGYVKPNLGSKNLDVISGATVLKLIFGYQNSQFVVKGVKYLLDNKVHTAKARHEVILSAGTINSAKILMLSGIGNSSKLADLDIDSIMDLPGVGKNIRDHTVINFVYFLPTAPAITVPSSVNIGFFKSPSNTENMVDIEIPWGLLPSPFGFGVLLVGFVVQVRNANIGEMSLRSKNPFEKIDISFNFDVNNLDPMLWGIRKVREWTGQIANSVEIIPGPNNLPLNPTDDQIKTFLKNTVSGWYHLAGSCKMGQLNDLYSVVDSNFRVKNISGLRVADNSIQPVVVSSHPSATATMLGELVVDRILNS